MPHKVNGLIVYSHKEIKDKIIGKRGTKDRDAFDKKVKRSLKKAKT